MPDHHPPEMTLGFLLHEVPRLLRRNFDRRVELTQAQWRALAYLARNEGINQTGLAELLEIRPITLTRIVDRLEQSGWVERHTDPDDRRACRLFLTERAGPLIKRMRKLADETNEQALAGLTPEDRTRLFECLRTMKHNLLAAETVHGGKKTRTDEE